MQQAPAKPGLGGGAGPRQPEASEREGVDWETLGKADPLSALLGMGILDRVAYILGQMPTPQTVLPLLGLLRRCAGGGAALLAPADGGSGVRRGARRRQDTAVGWYPEGDHWVGALCGGSALERLQSPRNWQLSGALPSLAACA